MFQQIPAADAYILKHILHDWDDKECLTILVGVHVALSSGAYLLIAEDVVPGPETADFSKIFEIHIITVLTEKERRAAEFADLLGASGWTFSKTWHQSGSSMAEVEGVRS